MKKSKKKLLFSSITIILFLSSIAIIIGTFIQIQNKIQKQMLKNYMEQIEELSDQIINTIHLEIENSVHILELISNSIEIDPNSTEKTLNSLRKIKKSRFSSFGIINNNGEAINLNGNRWKIDTKKFISNLSFIKNKHPYYVSDILDKNLINNKSNKTNEILIAIPLYKNNKKIGALFGYYPISEIEEEINISKNDQKYFYIIDTLGKYINNFTEDSFYPPNNLSIWNAMKKYKFSEENALDKIQQNIAEGKKGIFYFKYNETPHYVVYAPLGINKWYVFSSFTEQELTARAEEFQSISKELLFHLILLMVILITIIIGIAVYIYKLVTIQSKKIEFKNKMFNMLADKTKDIFYEIHFEKNLFVLYNFSPKNKQLNIPFEYVSPKNMLKSNYINDENLVHYQNLYNNIINKENVENLIIQLKKDGIWKWFRTNAVFLNPQSVVGILEDFTEEKEQELEIKRISEKSKYDFLTQLYNRETFEFEFNNFFINDKKKGFVSALFLLDLDNFKNINDKFGHRTGDKVLQDTSNTLKTSLRGTDILGRLGGDEFVVLIPNAPNIEAVHSIAKKLNRSLIKTCSKSNKSITISCSIGIAILKDDMTFKKAYEIADSALYHVKKNGRNSYYIE